MMAGKIPPAVIPSRGASVRKAQERCGVPLRTTSNRMTARMARTMSSAAPEATAIAPSAMKFRRGAADGQLRQRRLVDDSSGRRGHAIPPRRIFIRRMAQSPTVLMQKVVRKRSVPRKKRTV